jgi:methionine synthase I (cobalamin-dependent)
MAYSQLKQRIDSGEIIVLDGGTGTELQRRGVTMDPAAWCGPATLHNDQLLTEIHADYIRAGADVITANTYASGRMMLEPAGFGDRVVEINERAVEAALRARELTGTTATVAVAGSLSHMVPVSVGTAVVDPTQIADNSRLSDAYFELAQILKSSGVDHIMLEMMYSPQRIPLVLEAALSTGLPVWFGMSARRSTVGQAISFDLLEEYPISDIASLIPAVGVDVAGFMHTSSEVLSEAMQLAKPYFNGPWLAYPDSGYFEMPDWRFVDTIEPARLADFYNEWIAQGVRLIGGCCGLTIAHIEAAVGVRASLSGS